MEAQDVQIVLLNTNGTKHVGVKIGPPNHQTTLVWDAAPARQIADALNKVCDEIEHGLTVVRNGTKP